MKNLNIEAVPRLKDSRKVLLRFSYNCKGRKYFSTGVIIPSEFFTKDLEHPVKKGAQSYKRLNTQVQEVYIRLCEIRSRLILEKRIPTASLGSLLYRANEEFVAIEVEDRFIDTFYEAYLSHKPFSADTIRAYRTLLAQFDKCFGRIKESQFDESKWQAFIDWQIKKGMVANTIVFRLTKLKALLTYIKMKGKGGLRISEFYMPKEEVKKIGLDFESLAKLKAYHPEPESLQRVKDLCLFQCFTGLRISDLKRLNRTHIEKHDQQWCISMTAYKTNKPLFIPLSQEALKVLEKYSFDLPVVAEQYYNRELKKLLMMAGVDKTIEWQAEDFNKNKVYKKRKLHEVFTNHCCSRTAIAYFFDQGYAPNQVANIVGKSLETIMTYYYGRTSKEEILNKTKMILEKMKSKVSPSNLEAVSSDKLRNDDKGS